MLNVLTVSQFLEQINGIIAGEFIVEGEVAQYKISQGKWVFFDLKDDNSVVNCFSTLFTVRTPLEDGIKIRVTGYPKVREKSGRFSITVQSVELVGAGSLQRAYILLKQKLTAEGLFDVSRKRPLPFLPRKIGVIASRESAGFGDFKRILDNRWAGLEISLCHVLVQGNQAAGEIVQAFQYFNKCEENNRPEVIALIRGGGSMDDLAAFNTEEVARAVYGSKIPVVCGVGHERDETLADFAADFRASTPSNAAERLVPDKRELLNQLDLSHDHLVNQLEYSISRNRQRVSEKFNIISSLLDHSLNNLRFLITNFGNTINKIEENLARKKEFVVSSVRLLQNLNPRQILERGFAIARDARGNILRDSAEVDEGEEIVVELCKGKIGAEVIKVSKKNAMKQGALAV